LNVHRVVVTAVLLAAKFFDDAYYNNAYYAKVGGVLVHEMNGLEVDFLFRINFSLHATTEEFMKYRNELLSHSNVMIPTNQPLVMGMYSENDKNNDNVEICDTTPSPPPAQVSPEIHFSTTPTEITSNVISTTDHHYCSNSGTTTNVVHHRQPSVTLPSSPPTTIHQHNKNGHCPIQYAQHDDAMNIVPPEDDTMASYDIQYDKESLNHSEYIIRTEPSTSYFGFPLQPHPTLHNYPPYVHTRSNSMPLVIPQDTALPNSTTSPKHHQQHYVPSSGRTTMPKSDPIRSVSSSRFNNITTDTNSYNSNKFTQPIHCMSQFPIYTNNNNNISNNSKNYNNNIGMDPTTCASSTFTNLTSTTVSLSSNTTISSQQSHSSAASATTESVSSYYNGNLIFIDHDRRIQQPLHIWDGTPITIVQHHHHGTN
jgi:hypothetical protein